MKNKKQIEDSNLLNDLFYSLPERKERSVASEEELDEDLKILEEKKRARYEALKKKAQE